MPKQINDTDITELAAVCGVQLTDAERAEMTDHINKQLKSFEVLDGIDTNDIQPTFDLTGEGRSAVKKCGK